MVDVTLFELHLPNAEFNAPYSGESGSDDPSAEETDAPEGSGSGGGPLIALVVLLGVAALAWFLRNGGDDEFETDDEGPL